MLPPDAPPTDPSAPTPDSELTVLIKSPTDAPGTPPFNLTLPRTALVRDAKSALSHQYPSQPPATSQRLIHAGKLLADSTPLLDALTGDPPQVIHLVAAPRSSVLRRPAPSSPPVAHTPPPRDAAAAGGAAEGYAAHIQEVEAAFARLLHHQERYFALVRAQPPAAPEAAAAELAQVRAAIADYDASTQRQRDAIRGAAGAPAPAAMAHAPHPIVFPHMGAFQAPHGFQPLPAFHAMMYHQPAVPAAPAAPDAPGAPPAPAGAFPPGAAPNAAFPPGAVPFGAVPGQQQGPVWRRQFVFQFDFHWALLAKLAFFVFLLAQEGSPRRTKMLFVLALFIYLWQTGHLGFLRRLLAVILPSPNQLFVSISAMASAADGDPQREARVVPRNMFIRKTAVLFSYLYSFFYGFVCSLLPSWNPEPLPPLFHLFTLPPNNDEGEGEADAQVGRDAAEDQAMPPPDANWRPNDAPREAGHAHAE